MPIAADIEDKLSVTIKNFLNQCVMFTAYDVTISTRSREGLNLRHRDLNGEVHDIEVLRDALDYGHDLPNGQTVRYHKTQRQMAGGVWAFVYHPDHLDPANYVAQPASGVVNQLTISTKAPPQASITMAASNTDSGGEDDDGTFSADYRNRLMVPTKFMKDAGFVPGESVYVISNPATNTVVIVKDTSGLQDAATTLTVQTVERNGDVRLSSRTLRAAELKENKFVIETTDRNGQKLVAVKAG